MNAVEFIVVNFNTTREATLRVTQGLNEEALRWYPKAGSNPIGFLLWHTARMEDYFINRFIQGGAELWEAQGWHEKFGAPVRDTGYGFTSEQVENHPISSSENLFGYLAAVRASTL